MISSNQHSPMAITKAVASYTLLPDFWSRLVGFMPRFGLLAYLMAAIFESIRLLPPNHPFRRGKDIDTYRIRDVLAYAANNLHGGLRNVDQYVVFGIFLVGIVLLGLQFFFLFMMIATQTAEAAVPFMGFFVTVDPQTDVAHLMLDKVFGIPGFFNSCFDPAVASGAVCTTAGYTAPAAFPDPFQGAMQALFRFYTYGMLLVAGFVMFYQIVVMIIETANTGVPFGRRFQSIYTPMRLIIAVILLLPLAYGYNTGQYIVLLAAKYGSALATNSWLLFNQNTGDNPMGMSTQELVGKPKIGEFGSILNFMYLAKTCEYAYAYGMADPTSTTTPPAGISVRPYLVKGGSSSSPAASQQLASGTSFTDAKSFYGNGDVKIVFGEKSTAHALYPGQVKPYCGVITMPSLSKNVAGVEDIYNVYFKNVLAIWFDANLDAYGKRMVCVLKASKVDACSSLSIGSVPWDAADNEVAGAKFYIGVFQLVQANFTTDLNGQINAIRGTTNSALSMDIETLMMGWGGAGVWFNKIMSFNGAMVDALHALPTPTKYPLIMEHISKKKRALTPNVQQKDVFSLDLPGVKDMTVDKFMSDGDLGGNLSQNTEIANLLNETYGQVQNTQATSRPKVTNSDNMVKNFVTLLFGQTGIFDFRANSEVFPLAKLAMLGREILDKTVIMIASRALMTGVGSVVGAELGPMGDVIKSIGPGIGSFAVIGVSLGIMLYYVIPLMPFIYFFFAVGRWVKSIFEAMVAVPLWALAHLRLSGGRPESEGLPGPAAIQGYFLILEIFLRPILTLFGLAASVACFMALTYGVDTVFNLAVFNVGGYDMTKLSSGTPDTFMSSARDGIDALFYTVLYAMLIYAIATASFKLIDLLPNTVMRWGGTNTSSFSDRTDAMGEVTYNLGNRADMMARDIDGQLRGVQDTADTFADAAKKKEILAGPK